MSTPDGVNARPPVGSELLRVGFVVGTGRSGTHYISRLFDAEPEVAASHERHPLSDTYHRYSLWNQLPVDPAGFLGIKEDGIRKDLETHALSFEASAYLSLSVEALYEHFGARCLLLVRRPERTVSSMLEKGWYASPPLRADPSLAVGFQPGAAHAHHPFSRLAPRGEQAERWNAYTPVGRAAWFWRVLNERVLDSFERLPSSDTRVARIEELDHPGYCEIARFFGIEPRLTEARYRKLSEQRLESVRPTRTVYDWSPQEVSEFEAEVAVVADRLNYEWRVSVLRQQAPPAPVPRAPLRSWLRRTRIRLRAALKRRLPAHMTNSH